MVAGEGIASPTGRDIDGKYLDQNEQDLKTRYVKFQRTGGYRSWSTALAEENMWTDGL